MKSTLFCWSILIVSSILAFQFCLSAGEEIAGENDLPDDEIVLPQVLLNSSGEQIAKDVLDKKYVGLYFSASWCGPCRKFTPKLIEFRNKFSDEFEVVLVGGDGSAKAQANYMKKYSMPWLAIENKSPEAKHATKIADVEFIPFLVVLDEKGEIITKNGKGDILSMGEGAMKHWKDL